MGPVTLKSVSGKWIMASSILASSMAFIDSTALNIVLPFLEVEMPCWLFLERLWHLFLSAIKRSWRQLIKAWK